MSRPNEQGFCNSDNAFKAVVVIDTVWLAALTYKVWNLSGRVAELEAENKKLLESTKRHDGLISTTKGDVTSVTTTVKKHGSEITGLSKRFKEFSSSVDPENIQTLNDRVECMFDAMKTSGVEVDDYPSDSKKDKKKRPVREKSHSSRRSKRVSTSSESSSSSSSSNDISDPEELNNILNSATQKSKSKHRR